MATTVHELRSFRDDRVRVDADGRTFVGTIVQNRLGDDAVMYLLDTGADRPVVIGLDATEHIAEVDAPKAGEAKA